VSKSIQSVLLIGVVVILFTIGFTPYLSQEAFAHSAVVSAYTANDPDDGDTVFSNGDTLTITTSTATNATVGVIGDANEAFVTGNFTFAINPFVGLTYGAASDWQAEWTDASTLVITFANIGANTPVVATSTVVVTGGNTIGESGNPDDLGMTGAADTLAGDFGLFVAATVDNGGGGGCDNCVAPTLGIDENGRRIVDNGFTYNGNPIDVERYFTPYPLVTVSVGKQNVAEFKIYDDQGIDNISHLELAFGLANGESIGKSKAVINWDRTFEGIETITLDDPENVLDKIKITTSEGYCSDESQQKCLIVTVVHTFRAPLDFNILGTNVWDAKRNAWQNYYNHGIEVIGDSMNPPKEYDGIDAGQIYHLTETSKTTAVDEFGNTWSLKYNVWTMDYIPNEKIVDGISMSGYTRENSQFDMYKYGQYLLAENKLGDMCSECSDVSFDKIDAIFAYNFPTSMNSLDKPEIQKIMKLESERAQIILDHMLDPILYLK